MSDMISRLREISGSAGDSVAESLSSPETVSVMARRVRRGVRQRRLRAAAATASIGLAAAVAAIAVPAVLDAFDVTQIQPAAPTVVRTDGSLTSFSDGSMVVVLGNGRAITAVPTPSDASGVRGPLKDSACLVDPADLGPIGLTTTAPAYHSMLGFAAPIVVGDRERTGVMNSVGTLRLTQPKDSSLLAFEVQVDRELAPHVALGVTTYLVSDGGVYLYNYRQTSQPGISYEGIGADEVAVVTSRGTPVGDGILCDEYHGRTMNVDNALPLTAYIVADVWLVDRAGSAVLLGSYTQTARIELEES